MRKELYSIKDLKSLDQMDFKQINSLKYHLMLLVEENQKKIKGKSRQFEKQFSNWDDNSAVLDAIDQKLEIYRGTMEFIKEKNKPQEQIDHLVFSIEQLEKLRDDELFLQKYHCSFDLCVSEIPTVIGELELAQYKHWIEELDQILKDSESDARKSA